jgi:hypothetical protein
MDSREDAGMLGGMLGRVYVLLIFLVIFQTIDNVNKSLKIHIDFLLMFVENEMKMKRICKIESFD